MSLSLVAYGDSSDSESEEETAPQPSTITSNAKTDVRKLLSVLPAPKGRAKGGGKGPVRIGLPKLEQEVSEDIIICLVSVLWWSVALVGIN